MYAITHYINGKNVSSNGRPLNIYGPASGAVLGQLKVADQTIVNQAVAAAQSAFAAWSAVTPLKRARILFNYKLLLEQQTDELATLITQEHGKTLNDARSSLQRGIDLVEYVCGIPGLLKGDFSSEVANDIDSFSIRQPLGVCVGITPFNFPAMVPLWMFPMAIACGNTFVLKPSEKDPSCSLRLGELAAQAGVPDGVINIVQGDKETVNLLLAHPDVKAVSFVGSTRAAEEVFHTASRLGKRVQAFGGAKNHAVIMPDADLPQAAEAIVGAAYGSAGERCMAISVVVAVGDTVADQLIQHMLPLIKQLKIGDGHSPEIDMGPLITEAHWQRVKSYVDLGTTEGATLLIDGRQHQHTQGFYLGACLFDHVRPHMRIYQEEIFGPVLSIVRVADFASALQLINENEYGNGTAIFTRDGETARTFASRVQVGMVGINVPIPVPVAYHPFGGWKRSMFGDINLHGTEGLRFYTRLKTITQRWTRPSSGTGFIMPKT